MLTDMTDIRHGYAKLPEIEGQETAYTKGNDLRAVCCLARASGATNILEIGTAFGHTAVALAKVCPEAQIWTLGTCREFFGSKISRFRREVLPREKQGSFIRQQSAELQSRIHTQVSAPTHKQSLVCVLAVPKFQFAFIDAEHSWRSVVNDTQAVVQRIDAGGVVVWDDFGTVQEIRKFIEILNKRMAGGIQVVSGTRVCYAEITAERRVSLLEAIKDL